MPLCTPSAADAPNSPCLIHYFTLLAADLTKISLSQCLCKLWISVSPRVTWGSRSVPLEIHFWSSLLRNNPPPLLLTNQETASYKFFLNWNSLEVVARCLQKRLRFSSLPWQMWPARLTLNSTAGLNIDRVVWRARYSDRGAESVFCARKQQQFLWRFSTIRRRMWIHEHTQNFWHRPQVYEGLFKYFVWKYYLNPFTRSQPSKKKCISETEWELPV